MSYQPNDTRAATRQNARIKAELSEQAHGARMEEFDVLLLRYTNDVVDSVLANGKQSADALAVKRTATRAELREFVQTMSRRIKLR